VEKSLISKSSITLSLAQSIAALITSLNRPKGNDDEGQREHNEQPAEKS
jgi:hypothetical protein